MKNDEFSRNFFFRSIRFHSGMWITQGNPIVVFDSSKFLGLQDCSSYFGSGTELKLETRAACRINGIAVIQSLKPECSIWRQCSENRRAKATQQTTAVGHTSAPCRANLSPSIGREIKYAAYHSLKKNTLQFYNIFHVRNKYF